MEYKGKLYGRLGGKMYFDTGKTANDWDVLEKRNTEMLEMLKVVTDELTHCLTLLHSNGNKHKVDFQTAGEAYELIKEATEIKD
jgi:hypothetical protein